MGLTTTTDTSLESSGTGKEQKVCINAHYCVTHFDLDLSRSTIVKFVGGNKKYFYSFSISVH